MTDDEMRARLGDAMDGLTSAWAAIETVLVELRDRELLAEQTQQHFAHSLDAWANDDAVMQAAKQAHPSTGTPSIQERPY
jgi:hypothetical protein